MNIHVCLGFIKLSRAVCPSMMGTPVTVIKFLKPSHMGISVSGSPLSYLCAARVPHHSALTAALRLFNG